SDTAVVTIDIAAKKKKKKKKKKTKPDPDDRGGGRGGGGPGGPASNFAANCRATAEKYSELPPDVIAAKFGADKAVATKYGEARAELIPKDRSIESTQRAQMQVESLLANGGDELELDLAQAEYRKSVAIERGVVDATVQPPIQTFRKLVSSSRVAQGALPVHPLLETKDGVSAAHLYQKIQQPKLQREVVQFASRLKSVKRDEPLTDKLESQAVELYKSLTANYDLKAVSKAKSQWQMQSRVQPAKPAVDVMQALDQVRLQSLKSIKYVTDEKGVRAAVKQVNLRVEAPAKKSKQKPVKLKVPALGEVRFSRDDREHATQFVRKLAKAMPLLKQLKKGSVSAKKSLAKQYVEHAAAQTFYSEVVGKERLLAQREIME
ncbi:MAG: hypothetical protein GY927_22030, partial [bacterium]|nr:hypothetical protein [bacterium]